MTAYVFEYLLIKKEGLDTEEKNISQINTIPYPRRIFDRVMQNIDNLGIFAGNMSYFDKVKAEMLRFEDARDFREHFIMLEVVY